MSGGGYVMEIFCFYRLRPPAVQLGTSGSNSVSDVVSPQQFFHFPTGEFYFPGIVQQKCVKCGLGVYIFFLLI